MLVVLPLVVPLVVLPLVVPDVVEPEVVPVVPDVVPEVVPMEPEVVPLVVPIVPLPEVVPDVVEPLVLPEGLLVPVDEQEDMVAAAPNTRAKALIAKKFFVCFIGGCGDLGNSALDDRCVFIRRKGFKVFIYS